MKKIILAASAAVMLTACGTQEPQGLKDIFADNFLIGAALNEAEITGLDTAGVEILKKHYSSIVAENCMKSEVIHPEEGRYDFTLSDRFVELGEANDMFIIGHCLVWHSQLAPWFPYDENGKQHMLIEKAVHTFKHDEHTMDLTLIGAKTFYE